ncbi:hypothetical protein [Moraxella lacunata]
MPAIAINSKNKSTAISATPDSERVSIVPPLLCCWFVIHTPSDD